MDDLHEQIQSYLDKTMSTSESLIFQNKVATDSKLKEELDLMQEFESQLGDEKLNLFRSKLEDIVKSKSSRGKRLTTIAKLRKNRFRTMVSIAASFLILVGAGWFLIKGEKNQNLALMGKEYFVHYPANPKSRGASTNNIIFKNYSDQDYERSASELEQYATINDDDEANLFAAISYLGINNAQKSLSLLSTIKNDPSLNNKINYYKGIGHLKLENQPEAIQSFVLINEGDQFLFNKAQEILSKIQ